MLSIQYVLCCSAIKSICFRAPINETILSHHITVWNEICITYCLFVSSLICLPTLKESHCHIPILHTSWLSYAHRLSCIAKREDSNNNCIHSQSIIRRSKIFSLVVITLFVWHILFVSEEPKKERKWMILVVSHLCNEICNICLTNLKDDDYLMHQMNNKY